MEVSHGEGSKERSLAAASDLKKPPEMLTYYADKGFEVKALAEYQNVKI